MIKIYLGKCNGECIQIRYGDDCIYKQHTPCKMVWTDTTMDMEVFCGLTTTLLKQGWLYKSNVSDKTTPVEVQFMWDEMIDGPAYVMFIRNGKPVSAFRHIDALDVHMYKDRTSLLKTDIRELVKEYKLHPEYETLMT